MILLPSSLLQDIVSLSVARMQSAGQGQRCEQPPVRWRVGWRVGKAFPGLILLQEVHLLLQGGAWE